MAVRKSMPLIAAMVRRDLSQIHRQGLTGLVIVTAIIFLFGVVIFSMARSTLGTCRPAWTGDILGGCGPSERPSVTIAADKISGTAPLMVNFTATASGPQTPDNHAWSFGDVNVEDGAKVSHTYSDTRGFEARVRAFFGQLDVFSGFLSIIVTAPGDTSLHAGISTNVSEAGAPLSVGFGSNVVGGLPPYSYTWDFADGSNGTGPNPTHRFDAGGEFDVNLTVKDAGGSETKASVRLTAFGPGGEGGLPFTALDVVYGYHVLVTMLVPTIAFAGAYGSEVRKGTVRTLTCYPLGVWEITFAKLAYSGLVGLVISAPVALLPPLGLGMPGGDLLGIYIVAFLLSMFTLTAGALTSHAIRGAAKREILSPTTLPFLFVIFGFFFTRISVWALSFLSRMSGGPGDTVSMANSLAPLIALSPYHFGGEVLSAAFGGPSFPLLPILALPALLLFLGYRAAKRLYPDIFEKE